MRLTRSKHILTEGQPGITTEGVKITEDLDMTYTGCPWLCQLWDTEWSGLSATVYTARIIGHVNSVCSPAVSDGDCKDADGVTIGRAAVINKYIKHTIAHEVGHNMVLTDTYNKRFGGYHYKTGSATVLDQSVYYTNKNDKVTWYIGSAFTPADQAVLQLQ